MNRPILSIFFVLLVLTLLGGLATFFYAAANPEVAAPRPVQVGAAVSPKIKFNDSDPALIRLSTSAYEIAFRKSNGSIASIVDKSSGQVISTGNLDEQLWSVMFQFSAARADANAHSPEGPSTFAYAWDGAAGVLTFTYTPAPDKRQVPVTVTIEGAGETGLAMQLTLVNNAGYSTGEVRFPADLVFKRADVIEGLVPVMPGVALERDFFKNGSNYEFGYPGYPGVFADFNALTLSQGQFALFGASKEGDPLTPMILGYHNSQCGDGVSLCVSHNYKPRTNPKSAWTSPKVYLRVGEDWMASIEALRTAGGIDQTPSLKDKLGERYAQAAASPLYKADVFQLAIPYKDYPALLEKLAYPGILHFVGLSPKGHDENYPDFIPPAPDWGTTEDLAAAARGAQAKGFLVMPYTNPTWWDTDSPTLRKLPAGTSISQVSALNEQSMQIQECYGCPALQRYGYVVSPYSDFVGQRLARLMDEITSQVPSDFVFEDQIGARPAIYDYNPASPSPDAYLSGWIDHAKTYSNRRLFTELGFDRLIPYETGFFGSVLLPERTNLTGQWWWTGTWHVYPFVTALARDKALFSHHDLAPETFTYQKPILTWNAAMGFMNAFDLFPGRYGKGVDDPYINVVGAFQRYAFAPFASERVTGFTTLTLNVTRTRFEHYTVTASWNAQAPYSVDGSALSPEGFILKADDGSLTAGIFTHYNGGTLSSGDHYLIETRDEESITVRQPLGDDTDLILLPLEGGMDAAKLAVTAYTLDGAEIGPVEGSLGGAGVTFTYRQALNGQPVGYYIVTGAAGE